MGFNLAKEVAKADRLECWTYTIDLPKLKTLLHYLQDGKCSICGDPVSITKGTIDHVFPKSKKSKYPNYENPHRGNVLLAHHECNQAKKDGCPSEHERAMLTRVYAAINLARKTSRPRRLTQS